MAKTIADHLLLGTADLNQGMNLVKDKTGLSPVIGGSHPGVGTRNALLSLGSRQYLEIIAPDPEQQVFTYQPDLRKLQEPRLITWAAATRDISATAKSARDAGLDVIGPQDGSRKKPNGEVLHWKTLGIKNNFAGSGVAPIPFFIQWGEGVQHPSQDAPTACRIESLRFVHPESAQVTEMLLKLGIKAKVKPGGEARLTATLRTPKGSWVLS
jgi:Glyoxalase-like domain